MENCINVFVYGTLKSGFWNNGYLAEADFVGERYTYEAHFHMYDIGFPAVLWAPGDLPCYHICGELYRVNRETLANLDRLESEGHMYKRRLVKLNDGEYAFMYVWCAELYDSMIPMGTGVDGDCLSWKGDDLPRIVDTFLMDASLITEKVA